MYIPKHFEVSDQASLDAFIADNSFATLVSVIDGTPFATHLPLLLERDVNDDAVLLGHVALANHHHRVFTGEHEALAIFHGPHAYISPSWYEQSPAVPTWNYAAVHVYGRPVVVDDQAWLSAFVDQLTAYYDPEYAASAELPIEFKSGLLKGIVGFRMPVERVEGKYKLSQNRSIADQRGVIEALGETDRVATMMTQRLSGA